MSSLNAELAHELLHKQRSHGSLKTHFGVHGLIRHREDGCLKIRIPFGSTEAILINTGGGLAGGDQLSTQLSVEPGAQFSVTSQAAERVYRTLGPAATVAHEFTVGAGASFHWLPQETILFDGSALQRNMTVRIGEGATFLAVEAFILGRTAMAETLIQFELHDTWNIYRADRLIHAERLTMSGASPHSKATLNKGRAFATVMLIGAHAAMLVPKLRSIVGDNLAISCWNGKLLARLVAEDGFQLRKALKAVLSACLNGEPLPRNWEM